MNMRRRAGGAMVAVGGALAVVVGGPVDWGLGVLLAVGLVVGGVALLTDEGGE